MKTILTIILGLSIMTAFSQSPTSVNTNDSGLVVTLKVLNEREINITVTNISQTMIRAYSHVNTYETHYDYFEIEALTPDNDSMYFVLVDDRDKSAPVIVELKPGESFSHTIDFVQWAGRSVNKATLERAGLNHLPHGIKIRAKYRNSPCDNCNEYYKSIWTGYVFSDWVEF